MSVVNLPSDILITIIDEMNKNIYNVSLVNRELYSLSKDRLKAEIIEKTIEKMKLLNMLSDTQQVKWLEEHPDDYKFIVNPCNDVKNMKSFKKDL